MMKISTDGIKLLKNTINDNRPKNSLLKLIIRDRQLLVLSIPLLIFYIIFCYWPMYGLVIGFKEFSPIKGIFGSDWVGLKYFIQVFRNPFFPRLVKNTFLIGIYGLIWGFPIPILFALLINEVKSKWFKKIVQTGSYLPYFISVVVIVGLLWNFLSPTYGIVNIIYTSITGNKPINFMNESSWFRTLYISSGIWQTFGWNSIIFLAALAGIDQELYDSAKVDGCNRLQQIIHINIPGIMTAIMIMLILSVGNIMSTGFEKIILMYTPSTYDVADVISTYTYRRGILEANYSFGAATGLFNSVINMVFIIFANWCSKKFTDRSLW